MNLKLLVLAGVASALLWGSTANAVTVSIGLQGTGAIVPVASGTGIASYTNPAGFESFSSIQVNGAGSPPLTGTDLLNSNTLDVSASAASSLKIYVTSQGNTSPTGLTTFFSSFTSNLLTAGWTVMEQTFLDIGNGLFALTTPLSSATFTDIGISVAAALANAGAGPFSVTELYTITTNGPGNLNATIDLSTPIPGALSLFATGLLGLWALRRKRKAKPAESLDGAIA
jgi:hypothetical protein